MKREDFDNLDILEQIHYINNQLADGNTLRDITSNISIARSTIRNRFKKIGYSYTKELNIKVLDILVMYIDSLVNEEKKEANKKVPAKKVANKKVPAKEVPSKEAPVKKEPAKEVPAKEVPVKTGKPFNKVNVGDSVYFRVEGEEIEHEILIIYKGKSNIIGIMKEDEKEVFSIRKVDFNKQVFEWEDRRGEQYNIIVTL